MEIRLWLLNRRYGSFRIFWLITIGLGFSFQVFSQEPLYQYDIGQGASLHSVIKDISEVYNIDFSYDNAIQGLSYEKKYMVRQSTLSSFLEAVFNPPGITFHISGPSRVLLRLESEEGYLISSPTVIEGKVLDKNGNLLPFVSLSGNDETGGHLTDEFGKYRLELPSGQIDGKVTFTFLGYEPKVELIKNLIQDPVVILREKSFRLDEIIVLSSPKKLETRLVGNNVEIDPGLLKNLLASGLAGTDLFRNLQLLPGVSAIDDTDASVRIRGGNSDETMIIVDGIPIIKATHFFGIFSAVNPDYIHSLRLYKNVIPIEYGGKTSGLLLLNSDPSPDEFGMNLDINLLTSSINLKVPVGKKTSLLIGGRTTYNNVNNSLFSSSNTFDPLVDIPSEGVGRFLIQSDPKFRFHDFNFRILSKVGKGSSIDANAFYSYDEFENRHQTAFRIDAPNRPSFNELSYQHLSDWQNVGSSLNFNHQVNSRWSVTGIGFYAIFDENESISSSVISYGSSDTAMNSLNNDHFNRNVHGGGKVFAAFVPSEGQKLKFGITSSYLDAGVTLAEDGSNFFEKEKSANESTLFTSYSISPGDHFYLEGGGRFIYYSGTKTPYFSPRLSVGYTLSNEMSFKLSFSRYHQFSRTLYLENRFGQTKELFVLSDSETIPTGHSSNLMAGFTLKTEGLIFDVEAYHRVLSGIMEIALLTTGFDDSFTGPLTNGDYQLFTGSGTSTGIDILISLEKKNYTGWLAYTLSKTTNRFPEIRMNTPFAAQNDRRHQLKWINNIQLGHFDLSGNYIFSSGRPYTDIAGLLPGSDRRDLRAADRQKRLPSYHRIDVGILYNIDFHKAKMQMGISVFNLMNRQNVSYFQFIYNLPDPENGNPNSRNNTVVGTETDMLGRTLNLSIKLEY